MSIVIHGTVIHGHKVGRNLGFPTANLNPRVAQALQPTLELGVYASLVKVEGGTYVGAFYYGPRTYKHTSELVCEVHLLDFTGTLYGKCLEVQLGQCIRPPVEFLSIETLRQQIAQDILQIRNWSQQVQLEDTTPTTNQILVNQNLANTSSEGHTVI